jgi:hypothetical protein
MTSRMKVEYRRGTCTVNVDFVTFDYELLIKYQSLSIWEFNLPIKQQTHLDRTSVSGIFTRVRRGGGGYERMPLDSILINDDLFHRLETVHFSVFSLVR